MSDPITASDIAFLVIGISIGLLLMWRTGI